MVCVVGFEPTASRFQTEISSRLSYTQIETWQAARESNPTSRIWSPARHLGTWRPITWSDQSESNRTLHRLEGGRLTLSLDALFLAENQGVEPSDAILRTSGGRCRNRTYAPAFTDDGLANRCNNRSANLPCLVPSEGLEPPRLSAPRSKRGASANFTNWAKSLRIRHIT